MLSFSHLTQVAGLCVIGIFPVLTVVLVPSHSDATTTGPVIVVAMPWQDATTDIQRAGGYQIGPIQAPLGILTASDAENYTKAIRALGYWTLSNQALLALICRTDYDKNT